MNKTQQIRRLVAENPGITFSQIKDLVIGGTKSGVASRLTWLHRKGEFDRDDHPYRYYLKDSHEPVLRPYQRGPKKGACKMCQRIRARPISILRCKRRMRVCVECGEHWERQRADLREPVSEPRSVGVSRIGEVYKVWGG